MRRDGCQAQSIFEIFEVNSLNLLLHTFISVSVFAFQTLWERFVLMQAMEKENAADNIDWEVEERVGSDSTPSGLDKGDAFNGKIVS